MFEVKSGVKLVTFKQFGQKNNIHLTLMTHFQPKTLPTYPHYYKKILNKMGVSTCLLKNRSQDSYLKNISAVILTYFGVRIVVVS